MSNLFEEWLCELARAEQQQTHAVRAAAIKGPTKSELWHAPCGRGHMMELALKKIGDRGDVKLQFYCDDCALGGEGWFPAGGWANK